MQFTSWDLGQRRAGELVEVSLSGNAANVRLFDSSNFSAFKSGRNARGYGGHATRSPVTLPIPRSGRWHVVVDYGGYAGRGRAGVRVLPGNLPTLRPQSRPSLESLGDSVAAMAEDAPSKDWDVFISHAGEDKDEIARPLARELRECGLKVWYDEFEMRIGDSLRRKIDQGIANSRFGIVVLSPSFIAKGWPAYELDGLVTRSIDGSQVLLPLWHKLTKAEVIAFSPSLADKLARTTADNTLAEIAAEIADVVLRQPTNPDSERTLT